MFEASTYIERRKGLRERVGSGLILFLGNDPAPMNYPDNPYHFKQDSSFLYYFGLDQAGLAAVIDADTGEEIVFGHEPTVDEIVWTGPLPTLAEECVHVGVSRSEEPEKLGEMLRAARDAGPDDPLPAAVSGVEPYPAGPDTGDPRAFHGRSRLAAAARGGRGPAAVQDRRREWRRSRSPSTSATTCTPWPCTWSDREWSSARWPGPSRGRPVAWWPDLLPDHLLGARRSPPQSRVRQRDEGRPVGGARFGCHVSPWGYASDITRTMPVSGRFDTRQREIYDIVLGAP